MRTCFLSETFGFIIFRKKAAIALQTHYSALLFNIYSVCRIYQSQICHLLRICLPINTVLRPIPWSNRTAPMRSKNAAIVLVPFPHWPCIWLWLRWMVI